MLMSTEPCKKPFDVPLLFEGTADRLEDFGCGAKNNKRGGSCVQEEADQPRNQRWLAKKGKQRIKGGVPRNWSKSVSLNKLTWVEATERTYTQAKRLRRSIYPKLSLDS